WAQHQTPIPGGLRAGTGPASSTTRSPPSPPRSLLGGEPVDHGGQGGSERGERAGLLVLATDRRSRHTETATTSSRWARRRPACSKYKNLISNSSSALLLLVPVRGRRQDSETDFM